MGRMEVYFQEVYFHGLWKRYIFMDCGRGIFSSGVEVYLGIPVEKKKLGIPVADSKYKMQ